jgi:hypothetical protein
MAISSTFTVTYGLAFQPELWSTPDLRMQRDQKRDKHSCNTLPCSQAQI